jgi:predicted AAA+ superfamily ATPase
LEFIPRLFAFPEGQHFFLLGPRGTGKSTLLKQILPKAFFIDLLLPDRYRSLLARPERLKEMVLPMVRKDGELTVVIDEVQKVPALLEVVHHLIEARAGIQFILTGSSARKLRRVGSDMLAGRALRRAMHPFLPSELGIRFHLDEALRFGLLPVVLGRPDPTDRLHSYIDLYLREEVIQEGVSRNLDAFSRFLEAASFSHGGILNASNISRECQVGRKSVENYIEVLDELMLSYSLPVFTRRARRELSAHPKFFLFDTGVFRALRPSGPLDQTQEIEGAALEGLVGQVIRAWISARGIAAELYFWRTQSGLEVDFVIYGQDRFMAIEVKNSATFRNEYLKSLKSFGEDYPEASRVLLYRGAERLTVDGIEVWPSEDWLRQW